MKNFYGWLASFAVVLLLVLLIDTVSSWVRHAGKTALEIKAILTAALLLLLVFISAALYLKRSKNRKE